MSGLIPPDIYERYITRGHVVGMYMGVMDTDLSPSELLCAFRHVCEQIEQERSQRAETDAMMAEWKKP